MWDLTKIGLYVNFHFTSKLLCAGLIMVGKDQTYNFVAIHKDGE